MEKRESSNPRLYKLAPDESEKAHEKRVKKIAIDIKDRLDMLVQYTGLNRFATLDPAQIEQKAIIRILEIKGITTENEVEDAYHILIDERISKMESEKDDIKAKVAKQKAEILGKGLSLPPGFKKRGIDA